MWVQILWYTAEQLQCSATAGGTTVRHVSFSCVVLWVTGLCERRAFMHVRTRTRYFLTVCVGGGGGA